MHRLEFEENWTFDSLKPGITIEAVLRRADLEITCDAKIDTGAEVSLFSREIGEMLDLEIETGVELRLSTLLGGLICYGHSVEIETLGIRLDSFVYFACDYSITRNLLGRRGWLQSLKFGLDDYRSRVYLGSSNKEI